MKIVIPIIAAAEPDKTEEYKMIDDRGRAWRRFRDRINKGREMESEKPCKPEKRWKYLYTRKTKLARAKKLGFDYPKKRGGQFLDKELPINE
jgi:hypothetical protein